MNKSRDYPKTPLRREGGETEADLRWRRESITARR